MMSLETVGEVIGRGAVLSLMFYFGYRLVSKPKEET